METKRRKKRITLASIIPLSMFVVLIVLAIILNAKRSPDPISLPRWNSGEISTTLLTGQPAYTIVLYSTTDGGQAVRAVRTDFMNHGEFVPDDGNLTTINLPDWDGYPVLNIENATDVIIKFRVKYNTTQNIIRSETFQMVNVRDGAKFEPELK